MATVRADDEILDLLSLAPNVLDFQPSEAARTRVWELVARAKDGTITDSEQRELDHYSQIEHLLRLVIARARRRLQSAA